MENFSLLRNIVATGIFGLFLLLSPTVFGQQEPGSEKPAAKTITIHVTTDVNGKTTVIDTTVVTEGDFDADTYLREKGVTIEVPAQQEDTESRIIIRRPGQGNFEFHGFGPEVADSLLDRQDFVWETMPGENMERRIEKHYNIPFNWNDRNFAEPFQSPGMPFDNFLKNMPGTSGLDEMMPFGNPDKMVVKKKRNGKKVIITFNDDGKGQKNGHRRHEEERVIRHSNGHHGEGNLENKERIIIKRQPGGQSLKSESPQIDKNHKRVIIIEEKKQ